MLPILIWRMRLPPAARGLSWTVQFDGGLLAIGNSLLLEPVGEIGGM